MILLKTIAQIGRRDGGENGLLPVPLDFSTHSLRWPRHRAGNATAPNSADFSPTEQVDANVSAKEMHVKRAIGDDFWIGTRIYDWRRLLAAAHCQLHDVRQRERSGAIAERLHKKVPHVDSGQFALQRLTTARHA